MAKTVLLRALLAVIVAAVLVSGGFYAGVRYEARGAISRNELKSSLFHYRKGKQHGKQAREAARLLLDELEKKNGENAKKALDLYSVIITREDLGSEYGSLKWFCEYFAAPEEKRKALLDDRDASRMFRLFSKNDFTPLKTFLRLQYELSPEGKRLLETNLRLARLGEFLSENCPTKKEWAKTEKLIEAMGVKRGDRIADIGCGYGYYTFKFSDAVGEEGCVYAVDPVRKHLKYIAQVKRGERIGNIQTILSSARNLRLEENSIDFAFMDSLYHSLYAFSSEGERDAFIEGVKRALRKNGTLVVQDNVPAVGDLAPYAGHRISPRLVIAQLEHYGFRLVKEERPIPQRYVLVFTKL